MNNISNKNLVRDFYKNAIGGRNADLIDTYISNDYIQHSPSMKGGKEGLRDAMEYLKRLPKPKEDKSPIIVAIADGEYVMLLLDLFFMGKHLSVVDLFKVVDGMIVEHWDAIQDITNNTLDTPAFKVDDELDVERMESNKTMIRSLFDSSDLIGADLNKEFWTALRQREPVRLHGIFAEGNVVGVQSEGLRSGKRFAFYDFISIVDSKIIQHWCVEQEIVSVTSHSNGMI